MILGPKILLKLVKEEKLVEGLSERELTNPEGAGFDLRLGEVYTISGKSFLGVTERHTADISLVKKYQKSNIKNQNYNSKLKTEQIIIKPGEFYLVKTIESVNMPDNLTASITPRSTMYRSGIFIRAGNVPPGYCGGLIFGLKNEGPVTVVVELGARIVHVQFHEVKGGGNLYRGQWQGGRVSATKKEKQV
ncbi:2'-deoxycytidine 5'-triphosphate deaminase [Patescibacteria group bacterium]|nr:2'-deoxycytidine 5'-triphosphate deaminase [Patescibacteria group bacterium]